MNNAGTLGAADRAELLEVKCQRTGQRAGPVTFRGMDHHPRRFVDDRHAVVFVDNVQRYLFRLRAVCFRRRDRRDNGLAIPQLERWFSLLAIDADFAGTDRTMNGDSTELR